MRNRRRVLFAGCVLAMAVGAACSGGDSLSGAGGADTSGNATGSNQSSSSEGRGLAYDDTAVSAPVDLGDALPPAGPSVIKTADVSLRVDDSTLHESIRDIVSIARDNGGYVLSTDEQDDQTGRATVVLRIPAASFETALSDAESVGEVTRETVAGEDVGQEFVDLEARLRNFEAQEAVLLRLMARSESVTDTLRVQRELQDVQLEIERLRGRLRWLRDQTDLSTIKVRVAEAGTAVEPAGTLLRAWRRALDALTAIASGVLVALVVVVPIAIVALLGLLLVRFVWVRLPSMRTRDV
jgi:hypothetical protein